MKSETKWTDNHVIYIYIYISQTGTVGVLNSYYNGSMDKMIWGHDLTPADPQSLEGQHYLTPADPQPLDHR